MINIENYRYFTCHRYDIDISKQPTSKVPIRYRYRYIDIGDISMIFSIHRPTSTARVKQRSKKRYYLITAAVSVVYVAVNIKRHCVEGHSDCEVQCDDHQHQARGNLYISTAVAFHRLPV